MWARSTCVSSLYPAPHTHEQVSVGHQRPVAHSSEQIELGRRRWISASADPGQVTQLIPDHASRAGPARGCLSGHQSGRTACTCRRPAASARTLASSSRRGAMIGIRSTPQRASSPHRCRQHEVDDRGVGGETAARSSASWPSLAGTASNPASRRITRMARRICCSSSNEHRARRAHPAPRCAHRHETRARPLPGERLTKPPLPHKPWRSQPKARAGPRLAGCSPPAVERLEDPLELGRDPRPSITTETTRARHPRADRNGPRSAGVLEQVGEGALELSSVGADIGRSGRHNWTRLISARRRRAATDVLEETQSGGLARRPGASTGRAASRPGARVARPRRRRRR